MTSYAPPKKSTQYIFYVSLRSQSNTKVMQSNPTLAAGDVKISKDGGALANLATLPTVTPTSSKSVKVTVSATEMNADNILIIFSDASGDQWCDLTINLQTVANQFDDLNTTTPPTAVAIRSEIDSNSTQLAAIVADTNELQTDDIPGALTVIAGYLDTEIAAILADTDFLQQLLAELTEDDGSGNNRYTTKALEQAPSGGSLDLADFFDTDTGETAATAVSGSVVGEIVSALGSIPGSTEITDIEIDDGIDPLEGVAVWLNTDQNDSTANVLWAGTTNALGQPKDTNAGNPWLDAGTYYIWAQQGGYTFPNPTTLTVGAGPFTISGTAVSPPGSVAMATIIDQVQIDLNDVAAATWPETNLLQWLNDAIRDYSLENPRRRTTTITAVADQHKYDLPDDHLETLTVEYPTDQTPPQFLMQKPYTDLDFWTDGNHYDTIINADQEADDELWIGPTPTAGQEITVEYLAYHPHELESADFITVPTEHHHILRTYVMARATEWLQMAEQANPTSNSSLLMSMLAQNAELLRKNLELLKRRHRLRRRQRRRREEDED